MKKANLLLLVLAAVVLTTGSLLAIPLMDNDPNGEHEKGKATVKVVTIVDGVKTVKDTVIDFGSDFDLEVLEDFELDLDSILKVVEEKVENISINCEMNGDDEDHFMIKIGGEDMDLDFNIDIDNIEEIIEMSLEGTDSKADITKKMVIKIDGDEENIQISSEGDEDFDLKEILASVKIDSDDIDSLVKKTIIIKEYSTRPNAYDIKKLEEAGYTNIHKGNLELEDFSIAPNPNNGVFLLSFGSASDETLKVNVFDINGKNIYAEKIRNFPGNYKKEINIADEKDGAYFVTLKQDGKYVTKKFIKK